LTFSVWMRFTVAEFIVRMQPVWPLPSVFGRNLKRQPVRGVDTREECHWPHACSSFNRRSKGVGSNGILESANFCRKRAPHLSHDRGGGVTRRPLPLHIPPLCVVVVLKLRDFDACMVCDGRMHGWRWRNSWLAMAECMVNDAMAFLPVVQNPNPNPNPNPNHNPNHEFRPNTATKTRSPIKRPPKRTPKPLT
jgi:hypothetical protein